jgi:outer membrane protein assembly factor BamA
VKLLGNWNGNLFFNYDNIRWTNYFGIGNETELLTKARDFHRFRTRELYSSIGINRLFAFYNRFDISLFYNSIKILPDEERFLTDNLPLGKIPPYNRKHFGGALFQYTYSRLNHPLVPTKGSEMITTASITQNLKQSDSSFSRFTLAFNQYIPLTKSFVFRLRAGAATLTGDPEFYQLNMLGGGDILRGYRRSRFYGKSMVFNQNELQFIKDVRSYLFNGKAGLVALFDVGRVWHPGENSNSWHTGYGGGIILAPFEKISFYVTYALSKEDSDFGLRIHKKL